jgi:hypothetical protein
VHAARIMLGAAQTLVDKEILAPSLGLAVAHVGAVLQEVALGLVARPGQRKDHETLRVLALATALHYLPLVEDANSLTFLHQGKWPIHPGEAQQRGQRLRGAPPLRQDYLDCVDRDLGPLQSLLLRHEPRKLHETGLLDQDGQLDLVQRRLGGPKLPVPSIDAQTPAPEPCVARVGAELAELVLAAWASRVTRAAQAHMAAAADLAALFEAGISQPAVVLRGQYASQLPVGCGSDAVGRPPSNAELRGAAASGLGFGSVAVALLGQKAVADMPSIIPPQRLHMHQWLAGAYMLEADRDPWAALWLLRERAACMPLLAMTHLEDATLSRLHHGYIRDTLTLVCQALGLQPYAGELSRLQLLQDELEALPVNRLPFAFAQAVLAFWATHVAILEYTFAQLCVRSNKQLEAINSTSSKAAAWYQQLQEYRCLIIFLRLGRGRVLEEREVQATNNMLSSWLPWPFPRSKK